MTWSPSTYSAFSILKLPYSAQLPFLDVVGDVVRDILRSMILGLLFFGSWQQELFCGPPEPFNPCLSVLVVHDGIDSVKDNADCQGHGCNNTRACSLFGLCLLL